MKVCPLFLHINIPAGSSPSSNLEPSYGSTTSMSRLELRRNDDKEDKDNNINTISSVIRIYMRTRLARVLAAQVIKLG